MGSVGQGKEMPKQVRHDIQEAGRYTDVNTPPTTKASTVLTLTRRLRVPLSPQGRGNFCHTEPTPNCPPPHTPNCHAELILNCHAELVSASLLQLTESRQQRHPQRKPPLRAFFILTLTRRSRVPLSPQGRGEKRQRRGKGEKKKGSAQGKGRKKGVRAAWVFKGGKKPPTSHPSTMKAP